MAWSAGRRRPLRGSGGPAMISHLPHQKAPSSHAGGPHRIWGLDGASVSVATPRAIATTLPIYLGDASSAGWTAGG